VARTKRRDREERSAVGFCDPYGYSASGLMALFLARLDLTVPRGPAGHIEVELVAYPDRSYAAAIASRLFSPLNYKVEVRDGRLRLVGERRVGEALSEFPVMLLALDRRTRLFLSKEELSEVGRGSGEWVRLHPAARAIELALGGRPTPLRL